MKIIRIKEVKTLTGLSRSAIYALIRTGKFPRQIELGPKTVGWLEGEVLSWISGKVNKSRSREIGAGGHSVPLA